jgi:hypothetical protein
MIYEIIKKLLSEEPGDGNGERYRLQDLHKVSKELGEIVAGAGTFIPG